jgi:hypothetical protein
MSFVKRLARNLMTFLPRHARAWSTRHTHLGVILLHTYSKLSKSQ